VDKKVLVIGDIMLDKYIETEPVRISDEAPVMIVKITGDDYILGGAGNTAANLKAMGFDVVLQGIIGDDWVGDLIVDLIDQKGIRNSITTIPDNNSTLKMRLLCKGKQLIRIDSEELVTELNPTFINEGVDIIVISDYAKGVIGENTVKILKEDYDVPIIINGKPKNIEYYMGVDVVIFNKKEADEITNDMLIADALLRLKAIENILIAKGIFTMEEYSQEMEIIAKQIAKSLLQKAQIPGDLDELIKSLQAESKKRDAGN
jgi:rfaE bifunctional protein kinase chain/domain